MTPDGSSIVVVGDNGTGKSAIIDAVDFLLTGDIDRLRGRKGITCRDYGGHIDAEPGSCFVEAMVQVQDVKDLVLLRRSLASPLLLECEEQHLARVRPFLNTAAQRQHMLTRADILRFIAATGGDRADLVQGILNLDRVEAIRQLLKAASNDAKALAKQASIARAMAESTLRATLDLPTWNNVLAINEINRLRALLEGTPITILADAGVGLTPPATVPPELGISTSRHGLSDIIQAGKSLADQVISGIDAADQLLLKSVVQIGSDPARLTAARHLELLELGIVQLGQETDCPLCETSWEPGKLHRHLAERIDTGKNAAPIWAEIQNSKRTLTNWLGGQVDVLTRIIADGPLSPGGVDPAGLAPILKSLRDLQNALVDPIATYSKYRKQEVELSEQLGCIAARDVLRQLYTERATLAAKSPQQKAWDTLTRVQENVKVLLAAVAAENKATSVAQAVLILESQYLIARDHVLGDLYSQVKSRFVALYRRLHAPDEQEFDAELRPDQAALNFEVEFGGAGKVPPLALHSEGHQDSMGLCLFFALAEHAHGGRLQLCLLDDVVMAVDIGHRQAVATLLAEMAATTQFLVTTHEQVWARQLMNAGLVTSKQTIHLISWSLEGGPITSNLPDFIEEARTHLGSQNIPSAAAALRRGLETMFHFVAECLRAPVPYSMRGQHDYGQMWTACDGMLKDLHAQAVKSAGKWKQAETQESLAQFGERRRATLARKSLVEWAVNPNVHYNS